MARLHSPQKDHFNLFSCVICWHSSHTTENLFSPWVQTQHSKGWKYFFPQFIDTAMTWKTNNDQGKLAVGLSNWRTILHELHCLYRVFIFLPIHPECKKRRKKVSVFGEVIQRRTALRKLSGKPICLWSWRCDVENGTLRQEATFPFHLFFSFFFSFQRRCQVFVHFPIPENQAST